MHGPMNVKFFECTLILSCAADLSCLCSQSEMSYGKVSFPG